MLRGPLSNHVCLCRRRSHAGHPHFSPFPICLVVEVIVAITIVIVLRFSYVTLLYVNHFFSNRCLRYKPFRRIANLAVEIPHQRLMSGTIVVVCNSGEALNNRRGTIVGWSEERSEWTVAVYDGPTIQLGKRQLHTIDEGWHTDMNSNLFNKVGIMRHFQGPGSHKPPRHAEFRHRSVVPTGKMIEDFWGKRIWSYMEEQRWQIDARRPGSW